MNKINKNNLDGILWDMDGVLVDVSMSYRQAILRTAQNFIKVKKGSINMDDVNEIKNQNGMNNDWDATYCLILRKDKRINSVREFLNNLQEFRKTEEYRSVKQTFQNIYLGNSLSEENNEEGKKGLIDIEKLNVPIQDLKKLKERYEKMGIVTGRPRREAKYTMDKFGLEKIFTDLVAMEDTEKGKPSPDPIYKAIDNLELTNTIYVGDSPSDMNAAKAANIPFIYLGDNRLSNISFTNVSNLIKYLLT